MGKAEAEIQHEDRGATRLPQPQVDRRGAPRGPLIARGVAGGEDAAPPGRSQITSPIVPSSIRVATVAVGITCVLQQNAVIAVRIGSASIAPSSANRWVNSSSAATSCKAPTNP